MMRAVHLFRKDVATVLSAAFLLAGCGHGHDHDDDEPEITKGRILVADGDSELAVIDLDDGEAVGAFALESQARVYAARTGRYAYAVQTSADLVEVFESGIALMDHLGHFHIDKGDPSKIQFRIEGAEPSAFTVHDGWVTSFNDADGTVDFLQERSISAGSPNLRSADTGAAHRGVGVVAQGNLFASIPSADSDEEGSLLPVGIDIRSIQDPDEVEEANDECPELAGHAAKLVDEEHRVAFACRDGLLLVEQQQEAFLFRKIAYPDETSSGTRIGRLVAHDRVTSVVGDWGDEGLVFVDIEASSPSFEPVTVDGRVLAFAFDYQGEHLVVLTDAGTLLIFDADSGDEEGEIPLFEAFDVDLDDPAQIRPALAIGAHVYVSDPRSGRIYDVDVEDGEVEREIDVGGTPHDIAVFAMSPDYAEHAHGHAHD